MTWIVAALYQFTRFDAPEELRAPLQVACVKNGVLGTLLLGVAPYLVFDVTRESSLRALQMITGG